MDGDRWVEMYEKIKANAFAGKDKLSFEFYLLEVVDILNDDWESVKDMLDTSVEFFSVQHTMKLEEAKKTFHENVRYIAGYYGEEYAEKWRKLLEEYN